MLGHWGQGAPEGKGQSRRNYVGHTFNYAVFDIKTTKIAKFSSPVSNYVQQRYHSGQWGSDL